MEIEWSWDDQYVSARPKQTLTIPDEELEGLSREEQDKIIEDYVHEAFLDEVHYFWERKE